MDTENAVYLCNWVLLNYKKKDCTKFLDKWMELENILSDVTQSQEITHGIH